MKKRIVLILIILLVLGTIAGGIAYYVRRNTGARLLARAELSIRATQYDEALKLATDYTEKYPDDWRGYYAQGRAYMLLGRFADANQPLRRSTELNSENVGVWLLLANTHALPARKALADPRTLDQTAELRKVIRDLHEAHQIGYEANRIVARVQGAAGKDVLDVKEYIGLNHMYQGRARDALAARLEKDAKLAEAAGSQSTRDEKRRDANAESAAADQEFKEARGILAEVVRKDASRDTAANELVEMCIRRGDAAGLEEIRKEILAIDEANRPPLTTVSLIQYDLGGEPGDRPTDRKGRLDRAAHVLDGLLAGHPNLEVVLVARANVAWMQSDANTANELSQRVLRTNPRSGPARLCEARVLILRNSLPDAEKKLFTLITEFPQWGPARLLYGQVLASLGKKEPARAAMREVVRIDPNNAEARTKLVEWLLRDGLYRDAYDDAKALYEAYPKDMQALRLLAEAARDANQPDLAKAALNETRQKHPDEPEFLLAVAEGYARLGDDVQARRAAEQAANGSVRTEEGRFARARALQMTNRFADADALLESLVKEQPQSARAHFYLAQAQWQNRRRMEAMEHYRKATVLEERNVAYREQLARALLDVGQLEESLQECKRVLDIDPDNSAVLLVMSQARLIRGGDSEAVPSLAQGSSGASDLALAITSFNRGQVEKCIDICQTGLKRNPNDRSLRDLLAQAYLRTGRKQESLDEWKALLKADPEQYRPYQQLAAIWRQDMPSKDVEEALRRLSEARKYMVDLTIAEIRFQAKDYDAAVEAFRRAASSDGATDDVRGRARLQAAMGLSLAGRPEAALAELDSLSSVKGWQTSAMLGKARVLLAAHRSGETKTVLDQLRRSVEAAGDSASLALVAEAYAATDCLQESLAVCDALQRSWPNDTRAYLLRASVLTRGGQSAQAQEWCRKAIERFPGDPSVCLALAKSLESSQDIPGALDVLRKMASAVGAGPTASLMEQAALYARQGLYQPAIKCLEAVSTQGYAEDPAVKLELGRAFAALGRPQDANAILQTVPRYCSQYVSAQQLRAESAETDEARLAILGRLAKDVPGMTGVLAQQMSILLRAGRAQEAASLFAKAIAGQAPGQVPPDDVASLAVQALWESGKRREAAELGSRMAKDSHTLPWRRVASLLLSEHDPAASKLLLADPNVASPFDCLLGVVLCRDEIAVARAWQIKADPRTDAASQPAAPPAYRTLSALAVGDVARAEESLAKAPPGASMPRTAVAQMIGSAKADPNGYGLAADLLKAALARDIGMPFVGRSWAVDALRGWPDSQLAVTLALSTQPDESALKALVERCKPDGLAAMDARAALLLRQRNSLEAADLYGRLARARKDEPEMLMRQGMAFELAGKLDQAVALYQDVLKVQKLPAAANGAAYLLSQLYPKDTSRLNEATALVDQAIAAEPTNSAFRDTKGWIAYLLGQDEVARRELRQAMPGRPNSAAVHYHLGMAESKAGNAEIARLHLEAAVALSTGLPADKLAALAPATVRAGELAQEALKTLEPPKP